MNKSDRQLVPVGLKMSSSPEDQNKSQVKLKVKLKTSSHGSAQAMPKCLNDMLLSSQLRPTPLCCDL